MRRLIVFSDPGGAKPCLSLAMKWQESDEILACSDRKYAFFEIFGIPVRDCRGETPKAIFDEFCPDSLFTGTSYTSRIEMDFVREAAKRGIPSASFVDHYTDFEVRFGTGSERILPDVIHVLDNEARALACGAGLPVEKIRTTQNPYHEFLRQWRSKMSKEEIFRQLEIPLFDAKTILFAPDPLSNAGGAKKFGTDEVAVLKFVLKALGKIEDPILLLIKAHPNQSIDYLKNGLKTVPENVRWFLISSQQDFYLNDLIQHSQYVVGMFSNLLVEADCIGTNVIQILSNIKVKNPLAKFSFTKVANDETELRKELLKT